MLLAIELQQVLSNIYLALKDMAPIISLILIVLAGIVYGLSVTQPAEARGRWQQMAIGMFIGGIIIAAIVGAAETIKSISLNLLTES